MWVFARVSPFVSSRRFLETQLVSNTMNPRYVPKNLVHFLLKYQRPDESKRSQYSTIKQYKCQEKKLPKVTRLRTSIMTPVRLQLLVDGSQKNQEHYSEGRKG